MYNTDNLTNNNKIPDFQPYNVRRRSTIFLPSDSELYNATINPSLYKKHLTSRNPLNIQNNHLPPINVLNNNNSHHQHNINSTENINFNPPQNANNNVHNILSPNPDLNSYSFSTPIYQSQFIQQQQQPQSYFLPTQANIAQLNALCPKVYESKYNIILKYVQVQSSYIIKSTRRTIYDYFKYKSSSKELSTYIEKRDSQVSLNNIIYDVDFADEIAATLVEYHGDKYGINKRLFNFDNARLVDQCTSYPTNDQIPSDSIHGLNAYNPDTFDHEFRSISQADQVNPSTNIIRHTNMSQNPNHLQINTNFSNENNPNYNNFQNNQLYHQNNLNPIYNKPNAQEYPSDDDNVPLINLKRAKSLRNNPTTQIINTRLDNSDDIIPIGKFKTLNLSNSKNIDSYDISSPIFSHFNTETPNHPPLNNSLPHNNPLFISHSPNIHNLNFYSPGTPYFNTNFPQNTPSFNEGQLNYNQNFSSPQLQINNDPSNIQYNSFQNDPNLVIDPNTDLDDSLPLSYLLQDYSNLANDNSITQNDANFKSNTFQKRRNSNKFVTQNEPDSNNLIKPSDLPSNNRRPSVSIVTNPSFFKSKKSNSNLNNSANTNSHFNLSSNSTTKNFLDDGFTTIPYSLLKTKSTIANYDISKSPKPKPKHLFNPSESVSSFSLSSSEILGPTHENKNSLHQSSGPKSVSTSSDIKNKAYDSFRDSSLLAHSNKNFSLYNNQDSGSFYLQEFDSSNLENIIKNYPKSSHSNI
ncbi:hypothetical protein AYI70_g1782 [Smittium culicis]|uniref:Uncharacterized protein n=1 Tax=Smittium culicis TaxID=133412 RepID=A0A1R1X303_9FUNG|nr:hypothetical protein AYI70_g11204 [Smittium culicis]OMJ24141.1 hypothetical protein AYI70_g1782 [Smittium culicis]